MTGRPSPPVLSGRHCPPVGDGFPSGFKMETMHRMLRLPAGNIWSGDPPLRLHRARFFRDDPNQVVQYLHEAAAYVETASSR